MNTFHIISGTRYIDCYISIKFCFEMRINTFNINPISISVLAICSNRHFISRNVRLTV